MKHHLWSVQFKTPTPSRQLPLLFHLYRTRVTTSDLRCYGKDRKGEAYVFKITLNGKGHFKKGKNVYQLTQGKAVLFQTNDKEIEYWRHEESECPWEFIFYSCTGDTLGPIIREIIKTNGSVFDIPLDHPYLLKMLEYEKKQGSLTISYPENAAMVYELVNVITTLIQEKTTQINSLTERAIEMINHLPPDNLSVTILARKLDVTPEYLIRKFRAELKQTPHQVITELRLNLARRFLLDTRNSISEIAKQVGIPRESFSAWFKRNQGSTPKEYRDYNEALNNG